jgi:predicted enzyme related to lactoylglutathione lyase
VGALDVTKVYVMVPAHDMDRAVAFYRDGFGLTVRFTSPDWSELSWRDATVALHGGGDQTPRESWLGFSVDDLDVALAAVEAAGGRVGTERRAGGVRLVSVTDPEGNGLTVGQEASWA